MRRKWIRFGRHSNCSNCGYMGKRKLLNSYFAAKTRITRINLPHLPLLLWPEGALIIALCTQRKQQWDAIKILSHVLNMFCRFACLCVLTCNKYGQKSWPGLKTCCTVGAELGGRAQSRDVTRYFRFFNPGDGVIIKYLQKITLGFFKLKKWGAVVGKRM